MVGADTSEELQGIATGLARARGEAFFPALAQYLARLLNAPRVLVSEAIDDARARTLAVINDGVAQPDHEFDLAGTPCQAVLAGELVQMEIGVAQRFSRGVNGYQGYFGIPITAADGEVLGHFCAFGTHELRISPAQRMSCEMLAARAGAELQQLTSARRLRELERHQELLEARNRHLEGELQVLEREQLTSAASGSGAVPAVARTQIDLDSENTGLHHVQREHILRVLNATHWVIEGNSGAALKLGMKPATLRHRMKKLGIARARPGAPEPAP